MQRANDNQNQSLDEIRRNVATMAVRINQLERMLDQKSIHEAKVDESQIYQRESKLSLSNGRIDPGWVRNGFVGQIIAGANITINPTTGQGNVTVNSTDWHLGSSYCFGYDLNPDGDNAAEVQIYAGEVQHGARAIIDVAATKKVITADHQYLWVEYVYGAVGGPATIAGPSTSRPVSTDADSTFRMWLFLFRLISGAASIEKIGHIGNVILPGSFA